MEEFINGFDPEFNEMSESEKLYADGVAHLLDRDTKDYIEFLKAGDDVACGAAAEDGGSYGGD